MRREAARCGLIKPIVIDIFPRSAATRYFGDITRTVVKGRAGDSLKRMYETVLSAQERGLSRVCNQADGREIHREILALFEEAGFATGERDGRMQGFFHGTGAWPRTRDSREPRVFLHAVADSKPATSSQWNRGCTTPGSAE